MKDVSHNRRRSESRLSDLSDRGSDSRLQLLENLINEMIKDSPKEDRIRSCMLAAGLDYTSDPLGRMDKVLAELDQHRITRRPHIKGQA
jgi:hypothetical protein